MKGFLYIISGIIDAISDYAVLLPKNPGKFQNFFNIVSRASKPEITWHNIFSPNSPKISPSGKKRPKLIFNPDILH